MFVKALDGHVSVNKKGSELSLLRHEIPIPFLAEEGYEL